MKKLGRSRRMWICLNLILMILLSGMCYESVKADSLLARLHVGMSASQQTAHQLNDVFFGGPQNEGAEEVFGMRDVNVRLITVRRISRINLNSMRTLFLASVLMIVAAILEGWNRRIVGAVVLPDCLRQTIIHYIHQQDGAKG